MKLYYLCPTRPNDTEETHFVELINVPLDKLPGQSVVAVDIPDDDLQRMARRQSGPVMKYYVPRALFDHCEKQEYNDEDFSVLTIEELCTFDSVFKWARETRRLKADKIHALLVAKIREALNETNFRVMRDHANRDRETVRTANAARALDHLPEEEEEAILTAFLDYLPKGAAE